MKTVTAQLERFVCVKIETGEDILEYLQSEMERQGIEHGIILNGIGSISSFHLHTVETTKLPPGNVYFQADGPYDVDSVNGFIIEGKVHAHMVVSTDKNTFAGHLEKGTIALTFCVITIADSSRSSFSGFDYFVGKKKKNSGDIVKTLSP